MEYFFPWVHPGRKKRSFILPFSSKEESLPWTSSKQLYIWSRDALHLYDQGHPTSGIRTRCYAWSGFGYSWSWELIPSFELELLLSDSGWEDGKPFSRNRITETTFIYLPNSIRKLNAVPSWYWQRKRNWLKASLIHYLDSICYCELFKPFIDNSLTQLKS